MEVLEGIVGEVETKEVVEALEGWRGAEAEVPK